MKNATTSRLPVSSETMADFCRQNFIQELSLFGSAVTDKFGSDSDYDLLVTFSPNARIGFLALARMRRELTQLLGRPVDLVPKAGLKPAIRDQVLQSSRLLYAA